MDEKIVYSCKEHVEILLDTLIDKFSEAPYIDKIEEEKSCIYCEKRAEYRLKAMD